MSFAGWVTALTVLLLIIIVVLGVAWYFRNRDAARTLTANAVTTPPIIYQPWSDATPSADATKNTCQVYTFGAQDFTLNGTTTILPGQPSNDPNILNALTGSTTYPTCLDTDQLFTQQVIRTCQLPVGVTNPNIVSTDCIDNNGNLIPQGQTETYYSDVNCQQVSPCTGQLSLISINYQVPSQNINNTYCMQSNGAAADISMVICDPTMSAQLFRITRGGLDGRPINGQQGPLAQFLDRASNLCVVPSSTQATTTFVAGYVPGCAAFPDMMGTGLTVGPCTTNNGFLWYLLPAGNYCADPQGCQGCSPCVGCGPQIGTSACGGCEGCGGTLTADVPQQIIYVGGLDFTTLPANPTQDQIFQFLITNGAQALVFGGAGETILGPIQTNNNSCINLAYTSQYINSTLYNVIAQNSADAYPF